MKSLGRISQQEVTCLSSREQIAAQNPGSVEGLSTVLRGVCVCAGGRPQAEARMTMDLVAAADEGDSNEGASEKPDKFHLS